MFCRVMVLAGRTKQYCGYGSRMGPAAGRKGESGRDGQRRRESRNHRPRRAKSSGRRVTGRIGRNGGTAARQFAGLVTCRGCRCIWQRASAMPRARRMRPERVGTKTRKRLGAVGLSKGAGVRDRRTELVETLCCVRLSTEYSHVLMSTVFTSDKTVLSKDPKPLALFTNHCSLPAERAQTPNGAKCSLRFDQGDDAAESVAARRPIWCPEL